MKQSKDYFWASYLDLMTSLFAVMLVLFVLSYKMFLDKNKHNESELKDLAAQKAKLEAQIAKSKLVVKIENALLLFANANYFKLDNCNRTTLKTNENLFLSNEDKIIEKHKPSLENAGRELKQKIDTIISLDKSVEYVIFIEGTAALNLNTGNKGDSVDIFNLSYRRSLALLDLWRNVGIITTEKTPSNNNRYRYLLSGQEVLVAGSGYFGYCPDSNEDNNKRFVVQIIPKFKGEQTENAGALKNTIKVIEKPTEIELEKVEPAKSDKIDLQVLKIRFSNEDATQITITNIEENGKFNYVLSGKKQGKFREKFSGIINFPNIDFGTELGIGTIIIKKHQYILKLKNDEFTAYRK
jgi:hypothetical protein